jgi:Na+-driven multidrug efflux pump
MIDTLLVSPLGEIPLAAMAIASTIVLFILGIQLALASGSQLVISRAVGSGIEASISKAFCSGMIINFLAAFSFWILLSFFDQTIIEALTDDQNLHQQINEYLGVARYLVFFTAFTQVMIALFNGLGKTKIPFKGYLIELPVNIFCSYYLINGFSGFQGMGAAGAAVGSLIAISIRLVYLALILYLSKHVNFKFLVLTISKSSTALFPWSFLSLIISIWRQLMGNIKLHFIEIFPIAANVTMLAIGVTIYQLLYSQLSLNDYVAISLVLPWIQAGGQIIAAWSHSSAIMVSQAIGAKKLTDLNENINLSINIAIVMSIICAVGFVLLSIFIDEIYTQLDASTYDALNVIAPLYILLAYVRGYNTVHGNVLRALGKTSAVFKINFMGQWLISLPILAVMILYLDMSLFWAFAIQPFEEIIKMLPFKFLAKKSMQELDAEKISKLMYD